MFAFRPDPCDDGAIELGNFGVLVLRDEGPLTIDYPKIVAMPSIIVCGNLNDFFT